MPLALEPEFEGLTEAMREEVPLEADGVAEEEEAPDLVEEADAEGTGEVATCPLKSAELTWGTQFEEAGIRAV